MYTESDSSTSGFSCIEKATAPRHSTSRLVAHMLHAMRSHGQLPVVELCIDLLCSGRRLSSHEIIFAVEAAGHNDVVRPCIAECY